MHDFITSHIGHLGNRSSVNQDLPNVGTFHYKITLINISTDLIQKTSLTIERLAGSGGRYMFCKFLIFS